MSRYFKAQTVLLIFAVSAAIITPPDVVSQLVVIVEMVIIYGLIWLIVSRFKSLAQTPQDIKKLITVLVFLLTITITYSITLFQYHYQLRAEHSKCATSQGQTQVESQ